MTTVPDPAAVPGTPGEATVPPPWLEERLIAAWKRPVERDVFAPHRWALACGCAVAAISAVCVIFVGILGAVFGHTLLNVMRIRTKASRGLSMGTASHALGTARCAELDYQEGAFSSLALVLCGIITSLVAPFLFPLILAVVG